MLSKAGIVGCPRCGKNAAWNSANPYRPSCSERCKMGQIRPLFGAVTGDLARGGGDVGKTAHGRCGRFGEPAQIGANALLGIPLT